MEMPIEIKKESWYRCPTCRCAMRYVPDFDSAICVCCDREVKGKISIARLIKWPEGETHFTPIAKRRQLWDGDTRRRPDSDRGYIFDTDPYRSGWRG